MSAEPLGEPAGHGNIQPLLRTLIQERMSVGDWVPPWLRHQHKERYRFAGGMAKGRRVLDAACGNGYGSLHMRDHGATSVIGIDLELDAVRQAATFHRRNGTEFLCASALGFPFRNGQFDLFVSLETIEHIDDDASYVREARRIVREDGIFICSTPNRVLNNPGSTIRDRPRNRFHVREYTLDELDPLLRAHFPRIEWFGQAAFSSRYVEGLTWIGSRSPILAVRLNQIRNTLGAVWERRTRHTPVALPLRDGQTEVLIAVCSS